MPRALVASATIVAVAAVAFELPPADLVGRVFAVWGASAVLGVYLGLAELRGGLHALELGVGLAYSASVALGLWAALGEPRYDWLLGITAAQLTVAAAVRALAITRWTRLDWLTFRPLRTRAQSLRAGG